MVLSNTKWDLSYSTDTDSTTEADRAAEIAADSKLSSENSLPLVTLNNALKTNSIECYACAFLSGEVTMADPKAIGQQFLGAFYQTFDTNRAALGSLYVRGSAMEYV